jgi:hypothetical protein
MMLAFIFRFLLYIVQYNTIKFGIYVVKTYLCRPKILNKWLIIAQRKKT